MTLTQQLKPIFLTNKQGMPMHCLKCKVKIRITPKGKYCYCGTNKNLTLRKPRRKI